MSKCVEVYAYACYSDMGSPSEWSLSSIIVCPEGKLPANDNKDFFTLRNGESFDDVGYKFSSSFYNEARKIESIPCVGYRLQNIPTKNKN